MSELARQFAALHASTRMLIGVLAEADEAFWAATLQRGLARIERRQLAGATYVLGCFGGQNTLSDLVVARQLKEVEPLRFKNLNARLNESRTATFEAANAITSRRAW